MVKLGITLCSQSTTVNPFRLQVSCNLHMIMYLPLLIVALTPPELVIVTLVVHDLENYAYGSPQVSSRPKLLLATLPTTSKVYQMDGTEITATNMATSYITYDTATSSYRVRIRPPLDQYSKM